ncbi:site-specific integrase [Chitinophaga sp. sic0106]|uniref:tyrosine-type recombinase/integrase n=1 Tax=Chitinophaga sp. sic0106 TaxID=2854785 RepID=UPI001C460E86|nr:site-specific integrase [Chitinophaga sp. sic0106]MBV7534036.1 site-specific integrase [Chitinophaga sp. sic0106]
MKYKLAHIYPESLDVRVKKWHVEYYYENPITFQKERFKVYEDINRQPINKKAEYAIKLRDAINAALVGGYNPFGEEAIILDRIKRDKEGRRENYTIQQAIAYYLNEKTKQGKAEASLARYKTATEFFSEWLRVEDLLNTPARDITAAQIMRYLDEYAVAKEWTNNTYNNHLNNMHNLFNLLAKGIHGVVPKNPIQGAEQRNVVVHKHAAYTDEQLAAILAMVREKNDTNTEGVILTCYYACVRSRSEMRALKAEHILYDRDLIRLEGEDTKGRRDDFIPLDPELKAFYKKQGFHKIPGHYYLFSASRTAGPKRASYHMYAIDFRAYRDHLKLDDKYTLYSFKHTRNIHLAKEKVDPYALMQLNRHTTLEQTMKYLRDLGIIINRDATKDSRKI